MYLVTYDEYGAESLHLAVVDDVDTAKALIRKRLQVATLDGGWWQRGDNFEYCIGDASYLVNTIEHFKLPVDQQPFNQDLGVLEQENWLRTRLASIRFPVIEDIYVAAKAGHFYVTFAATPTDTQLKQALTVLQLRIERKYPLHNRYSVVFEHPDKEGE